MEFILILLHIYSRGHISKACSVCQNNTWKTNLTFHGIRTSIHAVIFAESVLISTA